MSSMQESFLRLYLYDQYKYYANNVLRRNPTSSSAGSSLACPCFSCILSIVVLQEKSYEKCSIEENERSVQILMLITHTVAILC